MTIVRNTVTDPTGTPIPNLGVPISLITVTPTTPGYTAASSIASTEVVYTDNTGTWSTDLTPNVSISPSGSYYRVTEDRQISNIRVPASGGPYNLPDLLVAPQDDGSLALTGLEVASGGTVVGVRPEINLVAGSNITVTVTDDPTNQRVNVTITGSGGGVQPTRLINTTAPLSGGGDLTADRTLSVNLATTSSAGVVQLAGDLGGTGASPTVPGLANKQPLAANLTALAALDSTTGLLVETGANAFTRRNLVAGSSAVSITNPAGVGGNPTVDVVPGNLTGIPESGVNGLVADLAARLVAANNLSDVASASTSRSNLGVPPTTRQIATTAPLSGGGDLSADRTLNISNATSAAVGVVQLAGDLTGIATAPTVAALAITTGKLADGAVTSAKILDGTILDADISGSAAIAQSKVSGLVAALAAKTLYRGTWAPSTAYSVNDLVTYAETLLLCNTAHTSSAGFALTNRTDLLTPGWRFNVKLYGAVGDDTTDDSVAINAACAAGFTYALAGPYFCQLYFPPGTYLVGNNTIQSSTYKGNAQIPLGAPVATTGIKLHMDIAGAPFDNTGLLHWQQTSAQKAGATIRSTLVGTNDGTWGEAAVFGCATPAQGYGAGGGNSLFSNILVSMHGIQILLPNDPHVCGVDLRSAAEANVDNLAVKVATTTGSIAGPTAAWQFGLAMPSNNNNDLSRIGTFTAEGMNFGLIHNEHCVADRVTCIQCVAAVEVGYGGGTAHGSRINYLSAENCNVGIGAALGGGPATKVDVGLLDWEGGSWNGSTFAVVNDLPGNLVGDIRLTQVDFGHFNYNQSGGNSAIRVSPTTVQARIYDMSYLRGPVGSPPAVPASGTPLFNPYFRDAAVTLVGGTVTAIQVGGLTLATLGITSGTFIVPTCEQVQLTYTGSPTWVWVLL